MLRTSFVGFTLAFAACEAGPSPDVEVCLDGDPREAAGLSSDCVELAQLDTSAHRANGPPSGVEQCANGTFNRAYAQPCATCVEIDGCSRGACADGCSDNAVCAQLSDDHCGCVSPCTSDDDCATNEACLCPVGAPSDDESPSTALGNLWPQCVPAACKTAADCESGVCGIGAFGCGAPAALQCRSEDDECGPASPCVEGSCALRDGEFTCEFRADC